jgi:hypothetical protein
MVIIIIINLGTLCNACGVKWKQGKIIIEESPDDDTEPNDSISVAQSSKPRKSSISAGKATTHSSPAKSGKKPSRLLSFNEGVISHTDEEEGRAEKPRVSRRGSTAGAPKRGRRASSSSKKGVILYIFFYNERSLSALSLNTCTVYFLFKCMLIFSL